MVMNLGGILIAFFFQNNIPRIQQVSQAKTYTRKYLTFRLLCCSLHQRNAKLGKYIGYIYTETRLEALWVIPILIALWVIL